MPTLPLLFARAQSHWRQAAADILLSSLAASFAWWLASIIFAHRTPIFAPIAAIVCLAPGIARRGRQAIGVLIGVSIGILVGETSLALWHGSAVPITESLPRLAAIIMIAMFAASSFGLNAVMLIEAGASAVLVNSLSSAGFDRIGDATIGGLIGLLFSQILFTPDPRRLIAPKARTLIESIADLLESAGHRLQDQSGNSLDVGAVQIRDNVLLLQEMIAFADTIKRWSLRGRMSGQSITRLIDCWWPSSVRLGARAVLFTDRLQRALESDQGHAPPKNFGEILFATAQKARQFAEEQKRRATMAHRFSHYAKAIGETAPIWHPVVDEFAGLCEELETISYEQAGHERLPVADPLSRATPDNIGEPGLS